MTETVLDCPAKINLILKVLKKRDDGYHEIFTVMQPVSLYDRLYVGLEEGRGIFLETSQPGLPSGPENLAYRAARAFLERAGLERRVSIRLEKRIPVGAGLGGGSSDAAGVLLAMNSLLKNPFGTDELMTLAAGLGSDVPFFILHSPAVATGRGEVLKRITLPRLRYLLVNPGFSISTEWVYGNLDLTKGVENNSLSYSGYPEGAVEKLPEHLENDLERVVCRKWPEVRTIKEALLEEGARASLMTGSGPTVFGIFDDGPSAVFAMERLKERFAGRDYLYFPVEGLQSVEG